MNTQTIKVVFLVSGNGGNLKFFHFAEKMQKSCNLQISVVGRRACGATKFAENQSLPTFLVEYSNINYQPLIDVLERLDADFIISTWDRIIDPVTVEIFRNKILNLHYSLLPSFAGLIGLEPIRQAYKSKVKYIGPTCHFVDNSLDGGQIIGQSVFSASIPIETAYEIMFRRGCVLLFNSVLFLNAQKDKNIKHAQENYYEPSFQFEISSFDEDFWRKLKSV